LANQGKRTEALHANARRLVRAASKKWQSSTSDLLMSNCDQFIYYDDLVMKYRPA